MKFNRNNLNVTKNDIIKEYKNISTKDILMEIINSISKIRIRRYIKYDYYMLFNEAPLTRKQAIFFLTNIKDSPQKKTAYMFRHLLRCAYHYGVPSAVIKSYENAKENYNKYKNEYNFSGKMLSTKKTIMHENAKLLLSCTLEMIQRSKSRKYKINTLMDKMVEKAEKVNK